MNVPRTQADALRGKCRRALAAHNAADPGKLDRKEGNIMADGDNDDPPVRRPPRSTTPPRRNQSARPIPKDLKAWLNP